MCGSVGLGGGEGQRLGGQFNREGKDAVYGKGKGKNEAFGKGKGQTGPDNRNAAQDVKQESAAASAAPVLQPPRPEPEHSQGLRASRGVRPQRQPRGTPGISEARL